MYRLITGRLRLIFVVYFVFFQFVHYYFCIKFNFSFSFFLNHVSLLRILCMNSILNGYYTIIFNFFTCI